MSSPLSNFKHRFEGQWVDAIDQSFNMMFITTGDVEDPRFLYVNKAFSDRTGYTVETLKGNTPKILQGPLTSRKVVTDLKETLREGDFFEGATVNYSKSGEPFWVEWNVSPIKNEDGQIEFFLCLQRDITEAKEAERNQSVLLGELSKHALVGEKYSAIMHQWKNQLTNLGLQFDALDMSLQLSEQSHEVSQKMSEMSQMIDYLMSTVKDFSGYIKPDTQSKRLNLSELIQTEWEYGLLSYDLPSLTFELNVAKDLSVQIVPNAFRHVIQNLLSNACDAMRAKTQVDEHFKPKLIVKAFESEHNTLKIQVLDNAGGIDKALLPHKLFEAYVTTKGEMGTGVGLYIVKNIVEKQLLGNIEAYNVGEGACFELTLKAAVSD